MTSDISFLVFQDDGGYYREENEMRVPMTKAEADAWIGPDKKRYLVMAREKDGVFLYALVRSNSEQAAWQAMSDELQSAGHDMYRWTVVVLGIVDELVDIYVVYRGQTNDTSTT